MELRRFGPAIDGANANPEVLGRRLGIFDEHVEIPALRERAGVEQLVLRLRLRAAPVRLYEVRVRVCPLRILVEVLHVRMRRSSVEVEVVLLDVLAVISLAIRQAEEALLQDRIASVPKGKGETQPLFIVREAGEPVFSPEVRARARLVVRKMAPGVAGFAVVLPDRSPLPFGQIRPPLPPRHVRIPSLGEPNAFCELLPLRQSAPSRRARRRPIAVSRLRNIRSRPRVSPIERRAVSGR